MHLQKTTLMAICVSLVCLAHSVTAMNNPEYQEGVRKRANDQPSTSKFDEASLTKHSMRAQEIEDNVAEEGRKEREEEDYNIVFNRWVEWAAKNQNSVFIMVLLVLGLGITICTLSQLIGFASAEAESAAVFSINIQPERWSLDDYAINDTSTYEGEDSAVVASEQLKEIAEKIQNSAAVLAEQLKEIAEKVQNNVEVVTDQTK
ncbi:hypothetical protein NECID01_2168 [Nematocida sp. AWRm77]|nr:hypothetical protein NECID01_2168 [Nematocida sp. AWRm77]